MVNELIAILVGYALGSLSTGYYLVRFVLRKDVRSIGSGSTGARNVGRLLGTKGFVITYIGDTLKGVVAGLIASSLQVATWGFILTMLAVVMGHIWPFQLKFQGGKGASTAYGVVLVYDYRLSIVLFIVAALLIMLSKRVTVSGIIATATLPVIALIFGHTSLVELAGIVLLTFILLLAHRDNIRDFLTGRTERGV